MYRYSTTLSPADLEDLENLRVEKMILVRLGDTIIFFSFTSRTRVSLTRFFIAIYSNKHTADVSCERDDINTGKRKK